MHSPVLSQHAADQYCERVKELPYAEILKAIDTPAVRLAIKFGAQYVRLGSGHRLVLEGAQVLTVLPPQASRTVCRRKGDFEKRRP